MNRPAAQFQPQPVEIGGNKISDPRMFRWGLAFIIAAAALFVGWVA